jgi:hypothetical protein
MNARFLKTVKYFAFGVLAAVPIALLLWSINESMLVSGRAQGAQPLSGSFSQASDPSCDPPARCGMDAEGDRGPGK